MKRAPQEQMTNFNFRFQKNWDIIPAIVRPSPEHAFLYYLKAINSEIAVMTLSMGGVSLPDAYEVAIREKNYLIQAGKIAPRPPMPIFPEIQPSMPLQIPPFTPFPTVPMLSVFVPATTSQ